MQTYTIILMVVACVVLGLSIWAFMTRCTDKFGSLESCPHTTKELDYFNRYERAGWCKDFNGKSLKENSYCNCDMGKTVSINCGGNGRCAGANTKYIIKCPKNTTPLEVKGASIGKPDSIVCIPNK